MKHYLSMIKEAWELQILPFTMRTSVISTIHKQNAKNLLVNYRPLSLTNCDYKILAFIFAERLHAVISKLINNDQTAYVRGRYIGTSIRNLLDIFEYCETKNEPGALLCIDFEKAFDSVEHDFIFAVLEKFNFGKKLYQMDKNHVYKSNV